MVLKKRYESGNGMVLERSDGLEGRGFYFISRQGQKGRVRGWAGAQAITMCDYLVPFKPFLFRKTAGSHDSTMAGTVKDCAHGGITSRWDYWPPNALQRGVIIGHDYIHEICMLLLGILFVMIESLTKEFIDTHL